MPHHVQLVCAGISIGYVEAFDDIVQVFPHYILVKLDDEDVDVDEGSEMVGVLEDYLALLETLPVFYAETEDLDLFCCFLELDLFKSIFGHQERDLYLMFFAHAQEFLRKIHFLLRNGQGQRRNNVCLILFATYKV